MSPRTGRPKSENPKEHDVKVRLNTETYEKLLKYCKEQEATKAEAIK